MYCCCAKTNVHYIRKVQLFTSIVHFLKEYVFAGTYYENHEEFVSESSVILNCVAGDPIPGLLVPYSLCILECKCNSSMEDFQPTL